HCANSSSSYLSSEEQNLSPNASAQHQALNLIKEAVTKEIHTSKSRKKTKNQTLLCNLELPIMLIKNILPPYLSRQEINESLDHTDNNNRLSNSNFIEDFSNLTSSCTPIQSKENFDLREVLSDVE
ncbi:1784_t:CDS:2, partial [Gigaspora rosea]